MMNRHLSHLSLWKPGKGQGRTIVEGLGNMTSIESIAKLPLRLMIMPVATMLVLNYLANSMQKDKVETKHEARPRLG